MGEITAKLQDDATQRIHLKWIGPSITTFYIVGIWPYKYSSNIYHCFTVTTVFSYLLNFLLMVVKLFEFLVDIDKAISHFNVTLFHHLAICKTAFILRARSEIERLCEELENNYTKMEARLENPISSAISRKMRIFNVVTIVLVALSGTNWTMMSIVSWIFSAASNDGDTSAVANYSQSRQLSYDLYLPFDWTQTPVYQIIWSYQTIIMGMVYYLNICVDSFYFTLLAHTSGQLQALTSLLNNLKTDSIKNLRELKHTTDFKYLNTKNRPKTDKDSRRMPNVVHINEPIFEDESESYFDGGMRNVPSGLEDNKNGLGFELTESDIDTEMLDNLNDCVNYHCRITRFSKDVENIMVWPMIVEFSGLTAMLCLQMFEAVTKEKSFDNTFKFINTAIVAISVLFMYCTFGHAIKTWGNKVEEAVYGIEWYNRSQDFKKACFFILLRGQKSIVFRCGPFYDVTLQTFIKVVQTAYSYFTIMMQINRNK